MAAAGFEHLVEFESGDQIRMKKILIVLTNMKMGGSERQALVLAQGLQRRNDVNVKVLALEPPGGQASKVCDENKISWAMLNFLRYRHPLKFAIQIVNMARAIRRERPEVILPFTRRANVICGLVWRATGARVSIWNQRVAFDPVILGKWLDWLAARLAPVWVANSSDSATYMSDKYKRSLSRIKLINNGVQLPKPKQSRAAWRRMLEVSDDQFLACMVANVHAQKDHATLIRAWRIVVDTIKSNGQSGTLLLAGRLGATYESLQHLSKELQLTEHVRFLGEVDDIAGLLSSVDLGVHSSHFEGTPNGVLECMAAGLPIVATDLPGIFSALGEESASYLFPKEDAEHLAQQIIKFTRDPELRARVGRQNRERVAREFSVEKMCDEFSRLMGLQD